MNEPRVDDETTLHHLLSKLLDGSITKREHEVLQNQMLNNPAAQRSYFDYLDLDTDLREMSSAQNPGVAEFGKPNRFHISWIGRIALATLTLAASLLLVKMVSWKSQHAPFAFANRADVVLVQSAGGQFFRDLMPAVGNPLASNHEYALVAGLIELKFTGGAEVILEAPAVIEIASADRLIVKQGSCSVHAPPGAEGFQVLTPQTEVTDLGTRFSISVDEEGDTDVHVVEGSAEVRGRDRQGRVKQLLKERQASRFESGDSSPIGFASSQYRRQLPDRLIAYQVAGTDGQSSGQLRSVSVQRDGTPLEYTVDQLIGVEVTHFRGDSNTHHLSVIVGDEAIEGTSRRSGLEFDAMLHTGILNPGGSRKSLSQDPVIKADNQAQTTPGMAIRFRQPIVNGPGPDVLFFELQSVLNPANGDAFHVSPLDFLPGLHSITITRYDITLNSPAALPIPKFDLLQFDQIVTSIDDLLAGQFKRRQPALPFFAIATSIDLSDLGFAQNTSVGGLFFQDAADDEEHLVDPVFIAGLPSLKDRAQ